MRFEDFINQATSHANLQYVGSEEGRKLSILELARENSLLVVEMAISNSASVPEFLSKVAVKLRFPTHFGGNLNALHDCLTDGDVIESAGVLFVIWNCDRAREYNLQDFLSGIASTVNSASRYWVEPHWPWSDQVKIIRALFHSNSPSILLDEIVGKAFLTN